MPSFSGLSARLQAVATSLDSVTTSAKSAQTALAETNAQADLLAKAEDAAVSSSKRIAETSRQAVTAVRESVQAIEETDPRLQEFLDRLGSSSSPSDQGLLDQVRLYLDQLIDMNDLTDQYMGISTSFEGQIKSVNQLLRDVLPSTSELQSSYRRFLDEIKGDENELQKIIERLEENTDSISQNFAGMIELIEREGTQRIDLLIRALENLKRAGLDGSEVDILGDRALQLLLQNQGGRGGL